MKNVTKHDLVLEAARSSGKNQLEVKTVVEELLTVVASQLSKHKTIEIRGFGTFYTKVRKPRPARNPRTGEVCPLGRRVVPLLKYSADLKHSIGDMPGLENFQVREHNPPLENKEISSSLTEG